ncbi:DnaJ domain-containing protein [Lipomyces arxii]|uniref:DnaJ domain-containing protein n=1 Tax=Lipomyces arxii TaxID=56418 RepID=UPI0034CDFD4B
MVLPDHYKVLDCSPTASQGQIRDAYKRAALATHPDRFPASSTAAAEATKKFQSVSDAYYVLSDETRRAEYDEERRTQKPSGSSYFANDQERERAYQEEFMGAFEEMFRDSNFDTDSLHPESEAEPQQQQQQPRSSKFYTVISGLAGSAIGFTIANVPGALAGLAVGAKLGNIRDNRGKPVYQVFQELPRADRARMLAELAQKMFSNMPLS